jgi:serine/threonine protein kinase
MIEVLYSYSSNSWKIADLGLMSEGTSKRFQQMEFQQGTPAYRSPELLKDGNYNNKSDIFALRCIFYELLFGKRAF